MARQQQSEPYDAWVSRAVSDTRSGKSPKSCSGGDSAKSGSDHERSSLLERVQLQWFDVERIASVALAEAAACTQILALPMHGPPELIRPRMHNAW